MCSSAARLPERLLLDAGLPDPPPLPSSCSVLQTQDLPLIWLTPGHSARTQNPGIPNNGQELEKAGSWDPRKKQGRCSTWFMGHRALPVFTRIKIHEREGCQGAGSNIFIWIKKENLTFLTKSMFALANVDNEDWLHNHIKITTANTYMAVWTSPYSKHFMWISSCNLPSSLISSYY